MSNIIDNILKEKSIATELENYTYVTTHNWDEIPLGSHIRFIDRNENVKSGGFLIKCVKNNDKTKTLVGAHVRRTDAVTSNRFVPDTWFVKVLKGFINENNSIFCFTDSIEKLSFLSALNNVVVFGPEIHPLESIVRLSKCDVLVLSRSTFSFWAAAISDSKKIISPTTLEASYLPLGTNVSYVTI